MLCIDKLTLANRRMFQVILFLIPSWKAEQARWRPVLAHERYTAAQPVAA